LSPLVGCHRASDCSNPRSYRFRVTSRGASTRYPRLHCRRPEDTRRTAASSQWGVNKYDRAAAPTPSGDCPPPAAPSNKHPRRSPGCRLALRRRLITISANLESKSNRVFINQLAAPVSL
jgi:hypothetical protein